MMWWWALHASYSGWWAGSDPFMMAERCVLNRFPTVLEFPENCGNFTQIHASPLNESEQWNIKAFVCDVVKNVSLGGTWCHVTDCWYHFHISWESKPSLQWGGKNKILESLAARNVCASNLTFWEIRVLAGSHTGCYHQLLEVANLTSVQK